MSSEISKKKKSKGAAAQSRSDTRPRPASPVEQDAATCIDEVDYSALVASLGPHEAVKTVFMHIRKKCIHLKQGVTKPSAEAVREALEGTKHNALSLEEIAEHRAALVAEQESQKEATKTEKLNAYAAAAMEYGYCGGPYNPVVTESETVRFVKWVAAVGADADIVRPPAGTVTRTAAEVKRQLEVRDIVLTKEVVAQIQGLADDIIRETWEDAYRRAISKGCKSISPRSIYNIMKTNPMLEKMHHPPTDVPIGALHAGILNYQKIAEIAADETMPEVVRAKAVKQMAKHPFRDCEVPKEWHDEALAVNELFVAYSEKRAAGKAAKEAAKAAKAAKAAAQMVTEDDFADDDAAPVPPLVAVSTTDADSSSGAKKKKKRAAPTNAPVDEEEVAPAPEKKKKKKDKVASASSA